LDADAGARLRAIKIIASTSHAVNGATARSRSPISYGRSPIIRANSGGV